MPSTYPTHNRLMSLRLRRMARYGSMFKVLHADPEVIDNTPDTDMVLFVLYSLNKQKRWEIQWNLDEKLLEDLQDKSYHMETMVLERELTDPFRAHWSHIMPHFEFIMSGSKVRTAHCQGSQQRFGGNGRFINKSRKKNKTDYHEANGVQIITYNIVRAPQNYKKIFENSFKNYKRPKDSTYRRKGQFDPMTTKIDWEEAEWPEDCYCCWGWEFGDFDLNYDWTLGFGGKMEEDGPREYYDLMDHIVDWSRSKSPTNCQKKPHRKIKI